MVLEPGSFAFGHNLHCLNTVWDVEMRPQEGRDVWKTNSRILWRSYFQRVTCNLQLASIRALVYLPTHDLYTSAPPKQIIIPLEAIQSPSLSYRLDQYYCILRTTYLVVCSLLPGIPRRQNNCANAEAARREPEFHVYYPSWSSINKHITLTGIPGRH